MSKQYVGKNVAALDKSPALLPYSKVVIIVGEDEETGEQLIYTAGDDTGRTLEINNPWGTAQMANDILSRISGYAYKPFSADQALVPDDADVGDAVSICGIYGMIVKQEITFDPNGSSSISAPEGDETENEFGIINSKSASERELVRKINHLNTRFTVDLGKIETEISDTASGLSSRITQTADAISSEVSRATGAEGGLSSRITQTANAISSEVSRATTAEGSLSTRITQTADAISSEVSRATGAESSISQTVESITLSVTSAENQQTSFKISGTGITAKTVSVDLHVKALNVDGDIVAKSLAAQSGTGFLKLSNGSLDYYLADTAISPSWKLGLGSYDTVQLYNANGAINISCSGRLYISGSSGTFISPYLGYGSSLPRATANDTGRIFFLKA